MRTAADVPLAPLSTLGVGGRARALWTLERTDDVVEALRQEPDAFVLGGGSNVVFADAGVAGTVLHVAMRGVSAHVAGDRMRYSVRAGEPWDAFVERTIIDGCAGLECLSGIPGTVGGTPIQNVGAYGREVSEHIVSVDVVDRRTAALSTVSADACAFAYRTSRFKTRADSVVVDVCFELARSAASQPIRYAELARALGVAEGATASLAAVRAAVLRLRRAKGMVIDAADPESRSVGSFFTNPIVDATTADRVEAASGVSSMPRYPQPDGRIKLAAGWLVERAGCTKGETLGGARISQKHALALVNGGGATAADIIALARRVRDRVHARFAVTLEPEPVLVGLAL
ncbi:MAG: UDP-N-acetylmuramate dehydrogenase [Deltaproteobacteria bacterium]|nr:UDP-N-acetylmuramate dehydrogenase [Deltaproteobacteria bacterium]